MGYKSEIAATEHAKETARVYFVQTKETDPNGFYRIGYDEPSIQRTATNKVSSIGLSAQEGEAFIPSAKTSTDTRGVGWETRHFDIGDTELSFWKVKAEPKRKKENIVFASN